MTELCAEDRPSAQEVLETISNDDKKVWYSKLYVRESFTQSR